NTLWQANLGQPRTAQIRLQHINLHPLEMPFVPDQILEFRVKANSTNSSVRYRKPDETWEITGKNFNPFNAGYCLGTFVDSENTADFSDGVATASVRILYGNPDKKLRKPLLFLDGLDLSLD